MDDADTPDNFDRTFIPPDFTLRASLGHSRRIGRQHNSFRYFRWRGRRFLACERHQGCGRVRVSRRAMDVDWARRARGSKHDKALRRIMTGVLKADKKEKPRWP